MAHCGASPDLPQRLAVRGVVRDVGVLGGNRQYAGQMVRPGGPAHGVALGEIDDGGVRETRDQLAHQAPQGLLGVEGADHGQGDLAEPGDFREVVLGLLAHSLAVRVAVRPPVRTLTLRGRVVEDDHRADTVPGLGRQRGR
ncbi:hypothetical protein GCM10010336_69340 [Streptomyces goshikiensis]|nr:hypothetical protein [Streptomyces goshikiensis]GHD82240.1 hypothetical protein GCM10010336_69340 [Streptomyces goshikiensis]